MNRAIVFCGLRGDISELPRKAVYRVRMFLCLFLRGKGRCKYRVEN